MNQYQQKLLNVVQVAEILCVSVSGVWAKVNQQEGFPQPFKLSAKQTRWASSEINDFIEEMMAARKDALH